MVCILYNISLEIFRLLNADLKKSYAALSPSLPLSAWYLSSVYIPQVSHVTVHVCVPVTCSWWMISGCRPSLVRTLGIAYSSFSLSLSLSFFLPHARQSSWGIGNNMHIRIPQIYFRRRIFLKKLILLDFDGSPRVSLCHLSSLFSISWFLFRWARTTVKNASSTLERVLALVSRNEQPNRWASALPSKVLTSLRLFRSHLLPTRITRLGLNVASSLILVSTICLKSLSGAASKLDCRVTSYTMIKSWLSRIHCSLRAVYSSCPAVSRISSKLGTLSITHCLL